MDTSCVWPAVTFLSILEADLRNVVLFIIPGLVQLFLSYLSFVILSSCLFSIHLSWGWPDVSLKHPMIENQWSHRYQEREQNTPSSYSKLTDKQKEKTTEKGLCCLVALSSVCGQVARRKRVEKIPLKFRPKAWFMGWTKLWGWTRPNCMGKLVSACRE